MAAEGFLIVESYGDVQLTEKGWKQGKALLERHQRVARFLQLAGIKAEQLLEETEKLEHMSSPETLRCTGSARRLFRSGCCRGGPVGTIPVGSDAPGGNGSRGQ